MKYFIMTFAFAIAVFATFVMPGSAMAQECSDYENGRQFCNSSVDCNQACYSGGVETTCGDFGDCDFCGDPVRTSINHVGTAENNYAFFCELVYVLVDTYTYPNAWPGYYCPSFNVCREDAVGWAVPAWTCCE